jgi:hypothetical protein
MTRTGFSTTKKLPKRETRRSKTMPMMTRRRSKRRRRKRKRRRKRRRKGRRKSPSPMHR